LIGGGYCGSLSWLIMFMKISSEELAIRLAGTAQRAGRAIMQNYGEEIAVEIKADQSPVTAADQAAEDIILKDLAKIAPDIPVIAEESVTAGKCPELNSRFFLVDPLDGTKEFINRRTEFTVNIALIESGLPIFGLIYAPALEKLYVTLSQDKVVEADLKLEQESSIPDLRLPDGLKVREGIKDQLTAVASRSHRDEETDRFLTSLNVSRIVSAGSSIKFCLLAKGEADVYPRFGRTMEWDIAAGHAILLAAGGIVTTSGGEPLLYGKQSAGFANPGFVAWGSKATMLLAN
jgi:3'(2'), 5'-bisphosphate nucleotidase